MHILLVTIRLITIECKPGLEISPKHMLYLESKKLLNNFSLNDVDE